MPQDKKTTVDAPAALAQRLFEALQNERIIPRFVDSYVVEHGRHALQVHASLYRDLLALLQREALLALTICALEIVSAGSAPAGNSKPRPMYRTAETAFRRKYLAAIARQQKWTVGDALDFQSDLQMYEDVLAKNSSARQNRKPFQSAKHPFVDRCAFLLDSSFMEKARLAASATLAVIEELAKQLASPRQDGKETPHRRSR